MTLVRSTTQTETKELNLRLAQANFKDGEDKISAYMVSRGFPVVRGSALVAQIEQALVEKVRFTLTTDDNTRTGGFGTDLELAACFGAGTGIESDATKLLAAFRALTKSATRMWGTPAT